MNKDIKKAIENDDLMLFIGAGMSIPLGFDNWNKLVLNILTKLKAKLQKTKITCMNYQICIMIKIDFKMH